MMAAFILACSIIFLLQFFISYCRSLIASSVREPLSQEVQEVTGMTRPASEEEFARVVQLLQLCPERPEERGEISLIRAYFRTLGVIRSTVARVVPSLERWTSSERGQCTHFVAVVLGRRIAFSRNLFAQQMSN
ncbi:MAG TPA: hypothetical protein VKP58_12270 [Candidatus Acidoferrum sp.]|nr:hypothetical protein [Candidatus Acidoferrum sp.]